MKWFYFENGANPYGIYPDRFDLFFNMILCWNPVILDNDRFNCVKPTPAFYKSVGYQEKKSALRDFAIQYQIWASDSVQSWSDVSWWSAFFSEYGKKFGLLREFRENGII